MKRAASLKNPDASANGLRPGKHRGAAVLTRTDFFHSKKPSALCADQDFMARSKRMDPYDMICTEFLISRPPGGSLALAFFAEWGNNTLMVE